MKKQLAIILNFILLLSVTAFGQNERKFVRRGNDLFMEAVKDTSKIDTTKFSEAETEYRKALNKKPTDVKWNYNLADALYKQQRFEEAANKFNELSEKTEDPIEKARTLHNLGNSQLMQQKIDESIESYKEALRKNPQDLDTKYNLAYAQMLKRKQEQQQQQQQQNKDQNQDQNQDQDKNKDQQNQDQNKQDQQDKQDQQQQQNQNKDQQDQQQNQQQQQQQQQNKISKQDAEQLLQALQNDERDIQEKVKKEKAAQARRNRVEKEW